MGPIEKAETIFYLLQHYCASHPTTACVGKIQNNGVITLDWAQYRSKIFSIIQGLLDNGIKRGDTAIIMAETSLDWHLADISSMLMGVVTVPIFPNTAPSDIEFIFEQTKPKIIFADRKSAETKLAHFKLNDNLQTFCLIDSKGSDAVKIISSLLGNLNTIVLNQLESTSIEKEPVIEISPAETATIIYTSGTTGVPKGAVISHGSLNQMLLNLHDFFKGAINTDDINLCFLPLSHVLGRCNSLLHLCFGIQVIFSGKVDKVIKNLSKVKPTFLIAVPRIFEKIYQQIQEDISKKDVVQKKLIDWAEKASNDYFSRLQNDLAPSGKQILERQLAYKLVYSKIYQEFGGRIRFFVSGGAPLSKKIIKFLRNSNLTILEGYGLTETIGPCCVTPIRKQIPGSVGLPIGDVKIKIADDGEILIQSNALFKEYLNNSEETQNSLIEGWFHTGDIGRLSSEGFLEITDRKKDIIITSTGKNVAPQRIENLIADNKYISGIVVYGNNRKFLTAIVGINKHELRSKLSEWELDPSVSYKELAQHNKVYDFIKLQLKSIEHQLSDHEQIKNFVITPFELSVENGYMTPSLKIKKKKLLKKMKSQVEKMYI